MNDRHWGPVEPIIAPSQFVLFFVCEALLTSANDATVDGRLQLHLQLSTQPSCNNL